MSTLAKLMVELGLDTKEFDEHIKHAHGSLKVFAAAVVGAGVVVGAGLFEIGKGWHEATNDLIVTTGASGKALTDLQDTTKDVFKSIPTSMATAAHAVGLLSVKTNATGKDLDELAKSEIELARITKTDLTSNITESAKIFNVFGIAAKDQVKTLDGFFRASQQSGVGVDQLMQEVEQFSPVLKAMGLSAGSGALLIGKLDKAGLHTSQIMMGLKKSLSVFAKAGVSDIHGGLTTVFNDIKNNGDSAKATAEAVKYFGAKAGPELAQAIREGKISVDDLTGAVDGSGDSILGTADRMADFSEHFKIFRNNVEAALIPLGAFVFSMLDKLIPYAVMAADAVSRFATALGQAFDTGRQTSTIVSAFPAILQPVVMLFLEIADAAGDVFRAFGKDGLSGAFNALGPAISQILGALGNLGSQLLTLTLDTAVNITGWLWDHKGDIWGGIKAAVGWTKDKVSDAITASLDVAVEILTNHDAVQTAVSDWIKSSLLGIDLSSDDPTWAAIAEEIQLNITNAVRTGPPIKLKIDAVVEFSSFTVPNFAGQFIQWVVGLDTSGWGRAFGEKLRSLDWSTVASDMLSALKIALDSKVFMVVEFAASLPLLFSLAIVGIGALMLAKSLEFIQGLLDGLGINYDNLIKPWAADLPTKISDAIGDVSATLYSKGVDLITGMNNGLAAAWPLVTGSISGAIAWILTEFATAPTWLLAAGFAIITGLNIGLANAWPQIVTSIRGAIAWILTQFITAGTWLVQSGTNLIYGLGRGIQGAWDGLDIWLSDLPGKIISNFSGAGSWLYDEGAAIVYGLANGIYGAAGVVDAAVNDLISHIPAIIRHAMGIGSPAKKMMPLGGYITEGLAVGIVGGIPHVTRAMGSVADALPQSMSTSFGATLSPMGGSYGGSGSSGGASGPVVYGGIHITVEGGGDADAVADRVFAKFSRSLQLQGAA